MYGLPSNFDPSFLRGRSVESITFAAYQVNVYLDERVWIQIEGGYMLKRDDKMLEDVSAFPITQTVLLQLIGKTIVNVSFTTRNGDIVIFLDNELSLCLKGENDSYESFRLFDGQKELIV